MLNKFIDFIENVLGYSVLDDCPACHQGYVPEADFIPETKLHTLGSAIDILMSALVPI